MHIAFIMDGNRRWASNKMMPKSYWHKKWVENLENLLSILAKYKVKTVTAWALSTENMKRSKSELDFLFWLIKKFCKKTEMFKENKVKFTHIWDISPLPKSTQDAVIKLTSYTSWFDGLHLQIAINYWWKDEIVRAVNRISATWFVSEDLINDHLDTNWVTDPELIVRTWWHKRLSNFMIWQWAYSELYFTDTFWPDFWEEELKKALDFYKAQQRNFWK